MLKVTGSNRTSPDYVGLVKRLVTPLLGSPVSLSVDAEEVISHQKIWLRVAIEASERGRAFGRGGRNIQAVRAILNTTAAMAGHSLYLDIYGGHDQDDSSLEGSSDTEPRRRKPPNRSLPTTRKRN